MLRENIKDAAEILSYILQQPLDIPGASPGISLLTALNQYDAAHAETSDLQKILQEFVKFPGPTQTLIQELELLAQDL